MTSNRLLRTAAAATASAVALLARPAAGQLIAAGIGAGAGVGRHHGATASASHAHAAGWVQLGLPLLPVAVRGDALLIGKGSGGGPLALSANAVLQAPLPIVTPYVIAGYGPSGIGGTRQSGWNAGAGVRVKAPVIPGLFGEVRRYQRLGRDLATFGVVF